MVKLSATPFEDVPNSCNGKKRVCVVVNGCPENKLDAALVRRFLGERTDFEICDDCTAAEIVILQGCSVTQHMENESRDLIAYLEKVKRPEAKLFVLGCLSKTDPSLRSAKAADYLPIVSMESLLRIDENATRLAAHAPYEPSGQIPLFLAGRKQKAFQQYIQTSKQPWLASVRSVMFAPIYRLAQLGKRAVESGMDVCRQGTFCVQASTGCRGRCSYCSIRASRGSVKSKSVDDVVAEFQRGLDQGYRHFALLGTDLGDYGKDRDSDLLVLLERIVELPGNYRVKLRNVNPRWLIPNYRRLFPVFATGKISYLQSPIQSGNDRILELMNRGHRAGDFLEAVGELRRRFPGVFLRTQLIAGFPTETDEEFRDSVEVIESGIFDYADVFRYTHRPGTPAASIEPEVPFPVIMRRYRTLFRKALLSHPLRKWRATRRLNAKV